MHPYAALAKKAVQEYITRRKILHPPDELPADMKQKAGVFVCLKIGNELRGCIGTFTPASGNLHDEIVRNAVAAATQDPRFCPLPETELEAVSYSVDVLSTPERIKDLLELDPQKYGVLVVKGARRGLLLPDLEGVDTVEDQLRIAKMKACLDPAEDDVEIFKFSVERYK